MGNLLSYLDLAYEYIARATLKRKIEDVDTDDDNSYKYDSLLHAPKRRRLMSTSQYIYRTLFEEGKDSDVTVVALGHVWNLHKVYLCQSPYFQSMFSGNWKETNEPLIQIEILDDNISIDSLQIALGSFYLDELNFDASQVISLLATSVLLQMDSVIDQCTTVMIETINIKTVLKYEKAARRYGVVEVEKASKKWLLFNLLTQVVESPHVLRMISNDLMMELVSSCDLYVMQTEFSLYVMLKTWLFLLLNPSWAGSYNSAFLEAHKYFTKRLVGRGCFLSEEGRNFASVFSKLRLPHLIYHYLDVEMIAADNIIPSSWILPAASNQWFSMLKIDQSKEKGPKNVSPEDFKVHCTRNGRVISANTQLSWRWTGFNFGLDLVMTHDHSVLKLKRNHRSEGGLTPGNHSNVKRQIMYRISVCSLNDQKQAIYEKSTGIHSVSLGRNEEVRLMALDKEVSYPLILSANFLVTSPGTCYLSTSHTSIADSVSSLSDHSALESELEGSN